MSPGSPCSLPLSFFFFLLWPSKDRASYSCPPADFFLLRPLPSNRPRPYLLHLLGSLLNPSASLAVHLADGDLSFPVRHHPELQLAVDDHLASPLLVNKHRR